MDLLEQLTLISSIADLHLSSKYVINISHKQDSSSLCYFGGVI